MCILECALLGWVLQNGRNHLKNPAWQPMSPRTLESLAEWGQLHNDPPPHLPIHPRCLCPNSRSVKIRQKGFCRCYQSKDLKVGRLSCFNQVGPWCDRKVTYKREAGRSKTQEKEAKTGVTELCAKEWPQQPLEAGRGKEQGSSLEFPEGTSRADTSLVFRPPTFRTVRK